MFYGALMQIDLTRSGRQPKFTSEELEDWEFVLCNMSKLEPVAFLPRLQTCCSIFESCWSVNQLVK